MTRCLAIAAPSLDWPSETFIRAHVQHLKPSQTVLICQNPPTAWKELPISAPVLTRMNRMKGRPGLGPRIARYGAGLWTSMTEPGLIFGDRRRVAAFMREHGVSVVLAEYGVIGVEVMGAARDAGARLYVHFHGSDATQMPRRWHWRQRYRRLFAAAAGVITPSHYLAGRVEALGCPRHKLHVSPCGIDPDRFRPGESAPHRVLAVGRFVEKKAPQLTIRAFAQARAAVPDAQLDMVGDGELLPHCRTLVRDLGLEDAVTLHGTRPPEFVAQLMAASSIFAQHSVTGTDGDMEGLPVSVLEAMAAALPVISTRHSGIPEAVVQGETGWLVDEHDVDGMATALIGLLRAPERATAMGEAGRQRILTNFTHEHTRRRLLTIMDLAP